MYVYTIHISYISVLTPHLFPLPRHDGFFCRNTKESGNKEFLHSEVVQYIVCIYPTYISVLTPHLFSLPIHDSFFRDHQRIRGMRNFSIQRLYPYKPFGFNQTLNFSFRELRIKGDSVSLNLFFNSKFFETPSFLILKNSGSALHTFQPWPDACLLFRLSNSSYD